MMFTYTVFTRKQKSVITEQAAFTDKDYVGETSGNSFAGSFLLGNKEASPPLNHKLLCLCFTIICDNVPLLQHTDTHLTGPFIY